MSAQNSQQWRLWIALILSALLMFADNRHQLDPLHAVVDRFVIGVYSVSHVPLDFFEWGNDTWASRQTVLAENRHLKNNAIYWAQRTLQFKALEAENLRLKSLLSAAAEVHGRVKMAEIIGINPDPLNHEVLLNRGTEDGIRVGQPVLAAEGLIGQVIAVMGPHSSRALLISDANHALPIQINRNGVRAIAVGSGHLDKLYLAYLPDSADVKTGDLLVSSGLGGRFPFGYPVARVTSIKHDPGAPFATAEATPSVFLDRLRHVLVLVHQDPVALPPPGPWPVPAKPPVCVPPPSTAATTLASPLSPSPIPAVPTTLTPSVDSQQQSTQSSASPAVSETHLDIHEHTAADIMKLPASSSTPVNEEPDSVEKPIKPAKKIKKRKSVAATHPSDHPSDNALHSDADTTGS